MADAITDHLTLSQWLSPAFPVSSYAYSHGLETGIAQGRVTDAGAVEAWIATVLAAGAGRTDALLLCAARRADVDVGHLADLARALASSAERWEETRAQGAAFAATQRAMGADIPDLPYPVALGRAARDLALSDEMMAALYLQAFGAALVSAAVRFVPLGQGEGQRLTAALRAVVAQVARAVADVPAEGLEDALGGAAFGADLAAMEHEGLEVRIFRS